MKVKTAKAAILARIAQAARSSTRSTLPDALGVGQVLVKVLYTTICGAQINEIAAAKGPDKFLPHLLGHEASARRARDRPRRHQRASPATPWSCIGGPSLGIQCPPPAYRWRGHKLNAGWVTTFNEYAVVSENRDDARSRRIST